MKIAIVRNSYNYQDVNSYNIQEIGLAKALVKKSSDIYVDLFFANKRFKLEKKKIHEKITVHYLPALKLPANMSIFPGLFKYLSNEKYALIQVGGESQIMSVLTSIYAKVFKIPLALFQGMYSNHTGLVKGILQKIYDAALLPILRRNTSIVLCKTQLAQEYISAKGFHNAVTVGIGLDTEGLPPPAFNEKNTRTILYVGKLESRRNPDFIVELAKLLKNDSFHFIVIGNGPLADNFVKNVAAERLDNITYIDAVSQKEIHKFYEKADIFILPSNYEIFGMVILESLYYGVPVFSTKNAGALDLIKNGENGRLFDNMQIQHWTTSIKNLFEEKEALLTMKKNCIDKFEQYTWESVANNYLKAYLNCIEK